MIARTVKDLGARAKERRKELGWSQSELAAKVGVQRLWVIQFESGKATVQVGLVLRALRELDLELGIANAPGPHPQNDGTVSVDLDSLLTDNLKHTAQ